MKGALASVMALLSALQQRAQYADVNNCAACGVLASTSTPVLIGGSIRGRLGPVAHEIAFVVMPGRDGIDRPLCRSCLAKVLHSWATERAGVAVREA